jgi:quercetin dioxygenase-like cupin family protein
MYNRGPRPPTQAVKLLEKNQTLQPYRLFRWDEIALEKVTEMVSRKFVSGERQTVAQIYLKRGAVVPQHAHDSEQMTYVLQGALKLLVAGDEVTLRDGEVLGVFSPVRRDWAE